MSEVDDIAINLAQHFRKQNGWGKVVVSASLSGVIAIAGAGWWFRGLVEQLRLDIQEARTDIKYLREHIDTVEKEAIAAKDSGDRAQQMVWASRGGYPPPGTRQP